jgi:hypothetical protein
MSTTTFKQPLPSSSTLSPLKPSKHHSMDLIDTISTCTTIFSNILRYTSSLPKRTPSLFDMNVTLKQTEETDSESGDSDSENQEMKLEEFIIRYVNYLKFDHHLLVLAMMLVDKALKTGFILTERNIQKFVFVVFVIVQKFFSDVSFSNKDYAKVGLLQCNELLMLELSLMDMLQFNVFINDVQYEEYNTKFEKFGKRNL